METRYQSPTPRCGGEGVNLDQLHSKAQALVSSLDLGERHAIVVEHGDNVTTMAAAGWIFVKNDEPESFRLVIETLFALGYKAGRADDVDLSGIDLTPDPAEPT